MIRDGLLVTGLFGQMCDKGGAVGTYHHIVNDVCVWCWRTNAALAASTPHAHYFGHLSLSDPPVTSRGAKEP